MNPTLEAQLDATYGTGTQFNFSYGLGVSYEQMIGFEIAGAIWSSYLADPVTINIQVESNSELPANVIGGAIPGVIANQNYQTWRNKLLADKTSANDRLATGKSNFQDDADKFTALIYNDTDKKNYKIDNNQYISINRANAKSVGLIAGNDSALDGVIVMRDLTNTSVQWNYSYLGNSANSQTLDFLSVAMHEIGHILGFVSAVDRPGWLEDKKNYDASHQSDYFSKLIGKLNDTTPLDMFRFSRDSVQLGGGSDPWLDISIGKPNYISVDGGKSAIGYYSTGDNTSLGGDGNQASHWVLNSNNPLGIMDPRLNLGQIRNISTMDLIGMDLIGWNLKSSVSATNTNTGSSISLLNLEARNSSATFSSNSSWQPRTWDPYQWSVNKSWNSTSDLTVYAEDKLAERLGITIDQLRINSNLAKQDRTSNIDSMLNNSRIYKWTWSGGRYWQTSGFLSDTLWQELEGINLVENSEKQSLQTSTDSKSFEFAFKGILNNPNFNLNFNDSKESVSNNLSFESSAQEQNEKDTEFVPGFLVLDLNQTRSYSASNESIDSILEESLGID
jgi:hypothetical protein